MDLNAPKKMWRQGNNLWIPQLEIQVLQQRKDYNIIKYKNDNNKNG